MIEKHSGKPSLSLMCWCMKTFTLDRNPVKYEQCGKDFLFPHKNKHLPSVGEKKKKKNELH